MATIVTTVTAVIAAKVQTGNQPFCSKKWKKLRSRFAKMTRKRR